MNNFRPGDLTRTPSGKLGTVQPPPWFMPYHTLILLDGQTEPCWILTDILQLVERCPAQPSPVTQIAAESSPIAQLNLFSKDVA